MPPSRHELDKRLRYRGRDPEVVLEKLMPQAVSEISHCHEVDHINLNANFDFAMQDLQYVLQGQTEKVRTLPIDLDSLIKA